MTMENDEIKVETDKAGNAWAQNKRFIICELKTPRHFDLEAFNSMTADSAAKTERTAAEPKDDVLDLYSQRLARHRGERIEKEIREAKPETPYEPLADYRYWEEVNRRREAESKGENVPIWIPCARSAEPEQPIDLFAERMKKKAEK